MVEKGARLLCANHAGCDYPCEACYTKAFAFIEMMGEPSAAMIKAGAEAERPYGMISAAYAAMIDVALGREPQTAAQIMGYE